MERLYWHLPRGTDSVVTLVVTDHCDLLMRFPLQSSVTQLPFFNVVRRSGSLELHMNYSPPFVQLVLLQVSL